MGAQYHCVNDDDLVFYIQASTKTLYYDIKPIRTRISFHYWDISRIIYEVGSTEVKVCISSNRATELFYEQCDVTGEYQSKENFHYFVGDHWLVFQPVVFSELLTAFETDPNLTNIVKQFVLPVPVVTSQPPFVHYDTSAYLSGDVHPFKPAPAAEICCQTYVPQRC